jgi:hypothetical protein
MPSLPLEESLLAALRVLPSGDQQAVLQYARSLQTDAANPTQTHSTPAITAVSPGLQEVHGVLVAKPSEQMLEPDWVVQQIEALRDDRTVDLMKMIFRGR